MRYLFLNSFAFENPKSGLLETDILSVFNNLGVLLKDLRQLNSELIFHDTLSAFTYNGQDIRYYLKQLNRDLMILLLAKMGNSIPFCSNSYDEYQSNENIVFGDCKVKDTDIDVLENYLACAMYLNAPVVTTKTLCDKAHFINDKIDIVCEDERTSLQNYFLEDIDAIKSKVEQNIKSSASSWTEWRENSLPLYQNISITDDCFDEISSHSYKSKYAKGIFNFIEKINSFVESKKVNNINFDECCSHTTEESDTRLKQFKGQLAVKNCKGQKEVASWHTRINNDFRLYFTLDIENNKICLVKLTKKIS